jgi:hypothetical protein
MVPSVSGAITRKSFRPSAFNKMIVLQQVDGPGGMLIGQSGLTYQEPSPALILLCRAMQAAVNTTRPAPPVCALVQPEREHWSTREPGHAFLA